MRARVAPYLAVENFQRERVAGIVVLAVGVAVQLAPCVDETMGARLWQGCEPPRSNVAAFRKTRGKSIRVLWSDIEKAALAGGRL